MNVLLVSAEFGNDGGGLSLSCEKIYHLLSESCNIQMVSSTDYPIQTVHGGYNKHLSRAIQAEYKLKEDSILFSDTDVVIGFGGGLNGYYAALLSNNINARFILCLRGTDVNLCKWDSEQKWMTTEACKRADNIVCLSNEMIRNVAELDSSLVRKALIIPNYYSLSRQKVTFANIPHRVILGCAASHLNEKKGVANLLHMVAAFKQISNIPIFIELAGQIDDDLNKQYHKITEDLSIEGNVNYLGFIPRDKLPKIMANWDFYIQGSVCEGHPNIIMECISQGKAFISSNTGFVAEVLSVDYPSIFFNSFAPNKMATQLLSLIKESNLEQTYTSAFDKMSHICSTEDVKRRWLQLLTPLGKHYNALPIDNIISIGLHDIQGEDHDSITTPKGVFQQFVDFISQQGYSLCSMRDYLKKTIEERRSCIVCTFDDGYKSMTTEVLPILHQYGFSATVFICTSHIGNDNSWNNKDASSRNHLTLDDIQTLVNEGWEIGSHGVSHRNLLKLNDLELTKELSRSQIELQNIVNCEIQTYAYPYGASNQYIQSHVSQYYKYAFSVDKGGTSLVADRYQIRRYSISEIYKMLCER